MHRRYCPLSPMLFGIGLILLVAGCAGTPAPVSLSPTPEFAEGDAGAGRVVALQVLDGREDSAVGSRDPAFGDRQRIESTKDVAAVLRQEIAAGLRAQGFDVAPYADSAERRLIVRLEEFAYESDSAVVTSQVAVRSAIAIEAHGPDQTFERRFATESSERMAFSPGEKGRAKAVNAALTTLIEQLFAEPTLVDVLAGS